MTGPASVRPLYLNTVPDPVFGIFHEAPSGSDGVAVLLCPPWGWDEVTSYRSRLAWADYLAAAGHPTLRIDFPGAGDSAGWPSDPARLEAWSGAIVAATRWLADSSGSRRVAVIGLGLGGLLAGRALADGAPIGDLVLWGAPVRGRNFLREQRAFANLQSSRYSLTGEPEPTLLPDGWLEVGGFVLAAETIAAIEKLDLSRMDPGPLRRALLLGRDGMTVDASLKAHLEGAGVDVTVEPGDGWGAMCFHPERYSPPLEVFGRVASWLAAGTRPSAERAPGAFLTALAPISLVPPSPLAGDSAELSVDGARIRETPIGPGDPFGQWFGILAEPLDTARADLCALLLNAGAIRRIGPNRIWVETGRRWAAKGVPTLRVDIVGIGDADGDAGVYAHVGAFYASDRGDQVSAIIDALEARGFGPRFALIGLCAGGYWAFNVAASDKRVVEAVVLNPRALVWDPELDMRREARLARRVLAPASWRRILRGDLEASRVLAVGRAVAASARTRAAGLPSRLRGRGGADLLRRRLERTLDRLRDAGTRVVLAFSGGEPVQLELREEGILARLDRWPNVVLEDLPARDHTVRPVVAQAAVHDLLDRELSSLLGRRAKQAIQPGSTGPSRGTKAGAT